ncbi:MULTISPECIES: NAD(P)H-dependent flavin oxidoreductase [Salimicrobium]|uniref:Probable nitronate monooxygenase n=2 Tax=Salimicrobium TaxID=351195 RepID=A0ABY1KPG3_9BACI|nr:MULTISPECIES: nitronate monooxygenase [Salimicrobium]SDX34989.1 2-nitropropane dioxygenase precursor [Salimicrobium album]SIS60747.1 2-nitropropane dioxygenase precursor [Salimicrobium salexigens]
MDWNTKVTDLLGIRYPIIQGGLAYLAYSELASAVSSAGGLGQITAMSLESPEELRKEIEKTREKTDFPFGVNFAIGNHGRPYEDMVKVAVEEEVPVVSVTGGNPKGVLELLKGTAIKKIVLVAAKRQAVKAEELGADAVMVVGQEGGGHIGRSDTGTFVLTPEVVDAVSIPVISSGGISDGRGLMAALALGAEGIEMGTRFIATEECVHAHEAYKDKIVSAGTDDTAVIKRSLGSPARALANTWTERILSLEEEGADYDKMKDYISGEANKKYIYEGIEQEGFGWAGQVSARISEVLSVRKLFDEIISEAEYISEKWR